MGLLSQVYYSEHTFDKGEEQCLCEFVLFWQHGPIAGTKTLTSIEHICLIQPGSAQNDPNLDFFLEISRKKLELGSHRASFVTEHEISANACAACFNETCGSAVKCEPNMPYKPQTFNSKEKKNPRQGHVTQTFKGYRNVRKKIGQDMDLGGGEYFFTKSLKETRNYHYILIENMETDLPSSVIVDFIYQQTSVSSHAYVTPSLLSESYTRGTIFLDGQEKLEKLSRFLHNPAHLIMSSRGRPWVIVEKEWRLGKFEGLMHQPKKKPQNKNEDHADKIKVVHKGTIEYEKGKQLSELFMEFCQHLQGLHKRLTLEERKILQSA
ncbi:uncharacterized protein LOC131258184 isoform X1 [Magnolia sinica]|uniref:uncharacterized protein LOC131258184 isoform X1 n=1 Tax=Magnolia sinica TaxID=86752 RepID=UPI002658E704|nr:uncharacterized protein LOC131258184 isoform X1 [Magnolia sinica]XP_058115288.1 uncharacterized protein LOC131258184 isoform X1 [Magnolia sinica]XP_058115289.1 uncharacterized protein LOC131258184 isoform X1 [Magnolia sinica]